MYLNFKFRIIRIQKYLMENQYTHCIYVFEMFLTESIAGTFVRMFAYLIQLFYIHFVLFARKWRYLASELSKFIPPEK